MVVDSQSVFIKSHEAELIRFWDLVKAQILDWKRAYEWPRGVKRADALGRRASLERRIKSELAAQRHLSKQLFDDVLVWGFGRPSACSAEEIRAATGRAFDSLSVGNIAEAARGLVTLRGVGISRASKVLALSDQLEFGVYDSRAAHGLSDLVEGDGSRVIPIPPGRVIRGDWGKNYCDAFEKYTWALRKLRTYASTDPALSAEFHRASDIEMALFMRSRLGVLVALDSPEEPTPLDLREEAQHDEESFLWTLGTRKTRFWFTSDDSSVTVWTGNDGRTRKRIGLKDIDTCLKHFAGRWFVLSNSKTAEDRDPDGLGEYFAKHFGSSVFASHFAALWVHHGLLACGTEKRAIKLKVT